MAASKGLGTTGNGAGTVTPLDHKLAQAGLIAKTGAGTNLVRPGLFYDGVSTIVSGKANMSYDVAPFTAALTRGATAGAVLLSNDGTVNVATTAAPGSNSRIDSVYVWQREFSLDGTDSNPVIGVVQGTAAASPTAPSLAAFPGAIELARITVPAGVTATNSGTTITQTAPFTCMAGGVLPFRTTAERNAATVGEGQLGWLIDSNAVQVYTGSTWTGVADSDWITWSTAPTNLTVGTGGSAASVQRYKYINGRIFFEYKYTLGTSGASVGTNPTLNLPLSVAILPAGNYPLLGSGQIYDASANNVPALLASQVQTTTTVRINSVSAGVFGTITATAPITFAAGDILNGGFWADPA